MSDLYSGAGSMPGSIKRERSPRFPVAPYGAPVIPFELGEDFEETARKDLSRLGIYGSPMQQSDHRDPQLPQMLRLTDPNLRRIVMGNPRIRPSAKDPRYGPRAIPKELGADFEEASDFYSGAGAEPKDKKKSLDMFDSAWGIVKDDMAGKKKALIACLKKEGGAAGMDLCCKATKMDKKSCKALINSMDNVKIHPSGDVILMDGLSKAFYDEGGDIQAQQVQKLHSYLSMATSMAVELGLDEIESMMVEAQEILENFSPGSEAEYYER